jgi:hypothetical protein
MEAADNRTSKAMPASKGVVLKSSLFITIIFPSHNKAPSPKNRLLNLSDSGKKKVTAKMQCSIKYSRRYWVWVVLYVIYTISPV